MPLGVELIYETLLFSYSLCLNWYPGLFFVLWIQLSWKPFTRLFEIPSSPPKEISTTLKSLHFKSGNFKWTLQVLIMAIYMRYSYKQTSGQNLHFNWCRSLYMLCELLALNKDWLLTPSSTLLFVQLSIHTICFNGFRARSKCRAPCVQDAGTEGGRRWPRSSRSSRFGQKDKPANEVTIYCNSMSPHWL